MSSLVSTCNYIANLSSWYLEILSYRYMIFAVVYMIWQLSKVSCLLSVFCELSMENVDSVNLCATGVCILPLAFRRLTYI